MLNRIVLLLSLLGMVLALHLWVQKERNFDQGCWGVAAPGAATTTTAGCQNSELEKASEVFGVSVAGLGYLFYFAIGVLTFARMLLAPAAARHCHTASEVVVALGFPFSWYLVYVQAFVARAFCPLCLVSTGIVTALFAIHAWRFWKNIYEPVSESARATEIGWAAGMGFAAMGALAGLMIMVNQVGTRPLDQGQNAKQITAMIGRSLPKFIEPAKLAEMKPALLNRDVKPLEKAAWLTPDTPILGNRDGVSIVAFLDPNCPSCDGDFDRLTSLVERHKDRVGLAVYSRVLWDRSLLQSQALELARKEGKYFEMWRLQFDRRKQDGLKQADIEKLVAELGVDGAELEAKLAAVRPIVVANRDRAKAAGINSTPTIFIDGLAVDGASRDERSLLKLIDQAEAMRERAAAGATPKEVARAVSD